MIKQRIDTLDFLRGFALLGIIFANITLIILPSSVQSDYFLEPNLKLCGTRAIFYYLFFFIWNWFLYFHDTSSESR